MGPAAERREGNVTAPRLSHRPWGGTTAATCQPEHPRRVLSTLSMVRLVFWGPRPRINQGVTVMGTLLRVQRAEVLVSPCPAAGAASGESRRPSGPHSPHRSHEPLRLKRVSAAPVIP